MSKKTKIALCLSGDPRSTMASFSFIYESFLQPDPFFEVDVYIHTWNGFRALPLYSPKNYSIDTLNINNVFHSWLHDLEDKYVKSPKDSNMKELLTPYTKHTANIHPLKNVFLMFYSGKKCFDLISEEYDFYIRSRFDLFFEPKINLTNILNIFNQTKDVDIICGQLYHPIVKKIMIDDQFFIGNYKSFKAYSNIITDLESLVGQTNSVIPEFLLEQQFNNHQINVFKYEFTHHIINSSYIFSNYPYFKNE